MKERLILESCFERGWSYIFLKATDNGHIVELSKNVNGKPYTYIANLRRNGSIEVLLNMAETSLAQAVCHDEFNRIDALIDASANVVRLR